MKKIKLGLIGAIFGTASIGQSVQASLANTGADVVNGMDQNWSVTSSAYTGPAAFLAVPNNPNNEWPFSPAGPWVADDSTSSWITYSSPLNLNAPAETYTYTENFCLASAETLEVRFLSDNESSLYLVDGNQQIFIACKGPAYDTSTFSMWSSYYDLNLGPGNYSFEINVVNDPWSGLNPTGVRFEESQVAASAQALSAVPEPTTVLAGALMLFPLGIGLLRGMRKEGGFLG